MLVVPSPKSQNRLVMVPVELSVKVTPKDHDPLRGLAVNAAAGTCAPMPVTEFVRLGPLLVRKVRRLLKLPVLVGVKLTRTLVELWPGRVKAAGESRLKGPAPILRTTLVTTTLPTFLATKLP